MSEVQRVTITFDNRPPLTVHEEKIETVWDAGQDFGHRRLHRYTTRAGKHVYWISSNSGMHYGVHAPTTHRYCLADVAAIRQYFAEVNGEEVYHREVEAEVDPESILVLD